MSTSTLDPIVLLSLPIVAFLLVMAFIGWKKRPRPRQEPALPPGALLTYMKGMPQEIRSELVGSLMVVSIGGFGLNQLLRLLTLLWQCGLDQLVGSLLIIENDAQERTRFQNRLPAAFRDRVAYAFSESFSGGMMNRDIDWVLQHVDYWAVPIARATAEAIDIQLRQNGDRAPGNILVFASLGGQGPLALPALEALHDRFEESQMVGFTALPRAERLRERFERLKVEYEKHGVFGWVLEDNLGADTVTSDYGMVAFIAGLADAVLHADQTTAPNNAFSQAFTERSGSILVYQVAAGTVIAYPFEPDANGEPRYYVRQQPLVEQVLRGLRRIEQDRGVWSADLPVGEAKCSTFDMVLASVYPGDMHHVVDDVQAAVQMRLRHAPAHAPGPVRLGGPNYDLLFASIATLIHPQRPICPVMVVRLAAVQDGAHIVAEIVKSPTERALAGRPMAGQLPVANGATAQTDLSGLE